MATLILPPLATLDASAAALVARTEDAAQRRALDKAAFEFHAGLTIVESAGAYLVRSFSAPGMVYRVSSSGRCSCKAGELGRACKHAAALDILTEAGRYTMPALTRKPTYAEALAEIDELF